MALIDDIMELFGGGQDAANQANEQRYGQIMRQLNRTQRRVGGQYNRANRLTRGIGRSGRRQINRQARASGAEMLQSMIGRGLASTTVTDSLQRQIDRDANAARQDLNESIRSQRAGLAVSQAGAEERMGGLVAQMMENRTDQGPDAALIAQLMSQLGQGQGGQGGGGGGSSFQVSGDAGSLGRAWMERNFGAGAGGGSGATGAASSGGGYYAGPGSAGAARAAGGGLPGGGGGGGFVGFPQGGGGQTYAGADPMGAGLGMIPGMGGGMFTGEPDYSAAGYVGENVPQAAAAGGGGGGGQPWTLADQLWANIGGANN